MKRPVPDEVILGLLKSKPSHGYDLLEMFQSEDQLGRMWRMSTSQLYAVLKRLVEVGAIFGERISSPDAPAKIVYSITDSGEEILEKWLFEPQPSASIHRIRVLFLSRLFIANLLEVDLKNIIDNQRRVCEKQKQIFLKERKKTETRFEKLTLDFITGQLDSALIWLNQCEGELLNRQRKKLLKFDDINQIY